MISVSFARDNIIKPTLVELLPAKFNTDEAVVMLQVIGLQESEFKTRVQGGGGPARSFWQFEKAGVRGVLKHPASMRLALAVCAHENVKATVSSIHERMATNDQLGCAFARLLLYTDPRPLPKIGDVDEAFQYYLRNWRPGAYKRDPHGLERRWKNNYKEVVG